MSATRMLSSSTSSSSALSSASSSAVDSRPIPFKAAMWLGAAVISAACALGVVTTAHAQVPAQATQAPDALIKAVSTDVLESVKADKSIKEGDIKKVIALVDTKVMPYLDFPRMTAAASGRYWRQATPEQQKRLEEEFKILLVRTYSGALAQVQDQTVEIKPMRSAADDKEVVVRSVVKGKGDPIQLDYRLEQTSTGWKIYDVNVLGVWLVENYRNTFADEIGKSGFDGLISKLADRNAKAKG